MHNTAAALAGHYFFQSLEKKEAPERDTVVFITGIPGAGKTSAISSNKTELLTKYKLVFEGQLANVETSLPKIQAVLDAGLTPLIKVVHANPEIALQHTFNRFNELGRGAGINIMAIIQGSLPNGLQTLYEEVGELVKLEIFDSRKSNNPKKFIGWQHLNILKSEGDYATIK